MIPTVPNIVFVITQAAATVYLTFLTAKGGLTDNRFDKPWKRLTKRGKLAFYVGIFITLLLGLQELNSQVKNNRKDSTTKKDNEKRESILIKERNERDSSITAGIKEGVDSSRQKLFADLTAAFAKQRLEFNPLNKKISDLKDSVKSLVVKPRDIPILMVSIIHQRKTNDTIRLLRKFISSITSAKILYINDFWEVNFMDGTKVITPQKRLIYGPQIISKEYSLEKWTTLVETKEIKYINIALFGKFSSLDDKKVFYLRDVYQYFFSNKVYETLDADARDRFYKNYNISIDERGL